MSIWTISYLMAMFACWGVAGYILYTLRNEMTYKHAFVATFGTIVVSLIPLINVVALIFAGYFAVEYFLENDDSSKWYNQKIGSRRTENTGPK
jgi:hypothetical protein